MAVFGVPSVDGRRQVRSLCRCCSALCGIVIDLDGDRVVTVRGDKTNDRSRGYICPKGASLPWFHHHPERLLAPRFKNGETDWQRGLDNLATRLRNLIDAHGADCVATYQGNGTVADGFARDGMVSRLTTALGSTQFYSAASVDVMPALRAAEMVSGSPELLPIWRDDEETSRLVIFWGINPTASHGYITQFPDPIRRIAAFRQRGGKAWVIDPRATRMHEITDRHLAIRPGTDAVLLAWLIRELNDNGVDTEDFTRMTTAEDRDRLCAAVEPFTRDVVAEATGLALTDMDDLLAQIRAAGRIAIVAGTGINFGRHALVTDWLRWVLLIVTGSLDRKGGMWFNPGWLNPMELRPAWPETPPEGWVSPGTKSRPELPRLMGQNSAVAIVDEIEAGNIRALIVAGANPLFSFPDPERLERALRSLEVFAVADVLDTSLTRIATDVLAASGQLERADILIETKTTMIVPAVVPAMGTRRPLWWIFAQLARRLGADLLKGKDPDKIGDDDLLREMASNGRDSADALYAAGLDGLAAPTLYGWVREKALLRGQWRLVPPGLAERLPGILDECRALSSLTEELLLVSGRHLTRVNGTSYVPPRKSRGLAKLHIHPNDAEKRQIRSGDSIAIRSANGQVTASVIVDDAVREGSVWLPHGFLKMNDSKLFSGRQVDPLTGQPPMTAIAVTLDRATAA